MAMKCCTKLETAKERCPIVSQGHPSNFKVTRYKTSPILTQIGRFRIIGRSQLSNPSDLPCFRSCIKFQAHTGWKINDLDKIWARLLGRSQLSNPSDLPSSRSSAKFQGQTAKKIVDFDPNWAFPDCNSSFNTPMVTKWCNKLEVEQKWCPIVFQGHTSNFKVTRLKKSSILTQIGRFRTVTPA